MPRRQTQKLADIAARQFAAGRVTTTEVSCHAPHAVFSEQSVLACTFVSGRRQNGSMSTERSISLELFLRRLIDLRQSADAMALRAAMQG
jgi:hypothetical protein